MSGRMVHRTVLSMIRLAVSPMPMGRTPGCLSRAINRRAKKGDTDLGSTYDVQSLLATWARAEQSAVDAPLKAVHSRLHS